MEQPHWTPLLPWALCIGLACGCAEKPRKHMLGEKPPAGYSGRWVVWHPGETQVAIICQYENGTLNGPLTAWHPNGVKAGEFVYRDGEMDLSQPFRMWEEDGTDFAEGLKGALDGFPGMGDILLGVTSDGTPIGRRVNRDTLDESPSNPRVQTDAVVNGDGWEDGDE